MFENSVFLGNKAKKEGGGVYCKVGYVLTIERCHFELSTANRKYSGAALSLKDNSDTTIEDTTLLNNHAYSGSGGAISFNNVKSARLKVHFNLNA